MLKEVEDEAARQEGMMKTLMGFVDVLQEDRHPLHVYVVARIRKLNMKL